MYFQRKPGRNNSTRVFVYHHSNGETKTLPRVLTKHLDTKADWEVDDWMRWYAAVNSIEHRMPFKVDLADLEDLLTRFLTCLMSQGKHPSTIQVYKDRLCEVLPYF